MRKILLLATLLSGCDSPTPPAPVLRVTSVRLATSEAQWTIEVPPGDVYVQLACITCRGGESRATLLGASTVTCTWVEADRIGVVVKSDGATATMAVHWGEAHARHERGWASGAHRQALADGVRAGDATTLFYRWAEISDWVVEFKDGTLAVRNPTGQPVSPEDYPGCIVRLWVHRAPVP